MQDFTKIDAELDELDEKEGLIDVGDGSELIKKKKIILSFLHSKLQEAREQGVKEERRRIQIDVLRLDNPYPSDVFPSREGRFYWSIYDNCRKQVLDIIDSLSKEELCQK